MNFSLNIADIKRSIEDDSIINYMSIEVVDKDTLTGQYWDGRSLECMSAEICCYFCLVIICASLTLSVSNFLFFSYFVWSNI